MKISIIQTGGTIDKDYPKKTKGYAFEISDPSIERILKKIKTGFSYEIISAFKKDSLDVTDEDRNYLMKICSESPDNKIIITHGTDTIIDTAIFLSKIKNKTIILTGSLLPERFKDSDAEFNIGVAIGAINVLGTGVYIAMNGIVIPAEKCTRDYETGEFHEIRTTV
jgi:L-asparaginase